MTCSPGISPNGSPLQKSPLPDSSTPQPALGFLTISLHTIDHQPRGAITFAHNGCRKLRAYAYEDRKSTRLNSSHQIISYAVFCLKKKKITHTLVIDDDGCYDPGDFNEGLLLGLKGTMAQAKLHFLRGRLQGGKLKKAQKGELRFPLPVGLCYDDEGRIVLDPNDEVRGAVQWVFRLFQKTGSAYAVVKRFTQSGLRFPKRAYGGAWAGQLIWGRLSHGRVLGLIKNPSY